MSIKVTDLEIGKIYKCLGDGAHFVRLEKDKFFCLSGPNRNLTLMLSSMSETADWEEATSDELGSMGQRLYLQKFPSKSEPSGCTCDIDVIMQVGCQCGWMQKERA